MAKPRTTFGAVLRRRREAAGLSVQQLGRRAGISRHTVYGLEREEYGPTLAVLFKLAAALETDPRDLIGPLCPRRRAKKK
jgi:transcriptional regulator with XRE-family HTH domain